MTRLVLGYAGCVIAIESTNSSALAWLREFVGPDFDERPDAFSTHTVRLREDGLAFETLRQRGPHRSNELIECFALDTSTVTLPKWDGIDADEVVFDDAVGVFYVRARGGSRTDVLSTAGNLSVRMAVLRVIREVAMSHLVRERRQILHAAALNFEGEGYVIAGPKEAGKTTLLLHLLSGTGASYLANDRVVLSSGPANFMVRGMPTIVRVRATSLEHLPALRPRFRSSPFHHRLSLDEADRLPPRPSPLVTESSDLTPAQLARLLGVSRSGEVPLRALLFPRRSESNTAASIERLGARAIEERLRGAVFRPGAPSLVGRFFADDAVPSDGNDRRHSACAALATGIAGFDCTLGPRAYEDPGSAASLLAQLRRDALYRIR